jgi:signal transduction histidine kinase
VHHNRSRFFLSPGARFAAADALAIRPVLLALAAISAPLFGTHAPHIRWFAAAMLLVNVSGWAALRRAQGPWEMLLPVVNAAGWAYLAASIGGGASPFGLGLFVEVGLAAMRLSTPAVLGVGLTGVAGFGILAFTDEARTGRSVALTGLACILATSTVFVLLLRRLQAAPEIAAERQRAAYVAHGLKNQLHGVAGFAELLTADLQPDDPRQQLASHIRSGIADIHSRLAELMAPRPATRTSSRVKPVVDQALAACDGFLAQAGVSASRDVGIDFVAPLDRAALHDILINLIHNAAEAMQPHGGLIRIASGLQPLHITVIDSGPGVHRELRDRIFEPRFSTRAGGQGLGLAEARAELRRVGGDLVVDDAPGGGAAFTLLFERDASRSQTAS